MPADFFSDAARRQSALRALLLSALCPGLGQVWCGRFSAALSVIFIRAFSLVIPAACVYSSRSGAVLPVVGGAAVFFGVHALSCIDSWRYAKKILARAASVRAMAFFAFVSVVLSILPAAAFLQLFPVNKLNDSLLFPALYKGDFVLCSARAASAILPGDLVFYSSDGTIRSGRIAAVNEGDTVELVGGRISLNGDLLELAPAAETQQIGNGFLFREKGSAGWYGICRDPAAKSTEGEGRIVVEKGFFAIVPDNRIEGAAKLVPSASVVCRIETAVALSWPRSVPVKGDVP